MRTNRGVSPEQAEALLTVEDVADRIGLNSDTVRRLIRRRDLLAVNVGRGRRVIYRVEESALRGYLDARRTRPLAVAS